MSRLVIALLLVSFVGVADEHNQIRSRIETIFSAADSQDLVGLNRYVQFMAEDVVLMPHNANAVTGKSDYKKHVQAAWQSGKTEIKHQLIDFDVFAEVVIARGSATGTFQPAGSNDIYPFKTKNLFVFRRTESDNLLVWQVIFNMEP